MIDTQKGNVHEPRYLVLETHKCSNLGISLVGGNAVGIYVHSVAPNSLAYNAGLRMGDHILEYNGTDLRHATAEEAAFEMAKPTAKVKVLVQNDLERKCHFASSLNCLFKENYALLLTISLKCTFLSNYSLNN